MIEAIQYVVYTLVAGISLVLTVIEKIKNGRNKKTNGELNKANNELSTEVTELNRKLTVAEILSKIPNWISKAEEVFGSGTGVAKNLFVSQKVEVEAVKNGVEIDDSIVQEKIKETLSTPQSKS